MAPPRRRFLRSLAAAPLAPAVLAPQPPAPAPAPAPPPPPGAPPSGVDGVAQALTDAVQRQLGDPLGGGEIEAVRKLVAESLESAGRLRAASRLGNADEPVTRFEARPPAGADTRGKRR